MDAVIEALNDAQTEKAIRVAIFDAMVYSLDPGVRPLINAARARLARLRRVRLLSAMTDDAPPLERQNSHDERVTKLIEFNVKRALRLNMDDVEHQLKEACHDDRCTGDVSTSRSYRAYCLQHFLTCLGIRIGTRLRNDRAQGYAIRADVHDLMQRFVDDPAETWLDENQAFNNLPSQLESEFDRAVLPTAIGKINARTREAFEARMYRSHVRSIKKIVEVIKKIESAPDPPSDALM